MTLLYINTCNKEVIIKLFKNHKCIKEELISNQKQNSQFIMPSIKKVLDGKLPECIGVVVGPGSFTGIRLGVTIAKTFGYVKNIPVKTITTLKEVALSTKKEEKYVSVKENNGYFIAKYNNKNEKIEEYKYINNEDYIDFKSKHNIYSNMNLNYKEIAKYLLKKESENPHTIKPVYVKTIEALK